MIIMVIFIMVELDNTSNEEIYVHVADDSGLDTWSKKYASWEANYVAEADLKLGKAKRIGINGFGRIGRLVLRNVSTQNFWIYYISQN